MWKASSADDFNEFTGPTARKRVIFPSRMANSHAGGVNIHRRTVCSTHAFAICLRSANATAICVAIFLSSPPRRLTVAAAPHVFSCAAVSGTASAPHGVRDGGVQTQGRVGGHSRVGAAGRRGSVHGAVSYQQANARAGVRGVVASMPKTPQPCPRRGAACDCTYIAHTD